MSWGDTREGKVNKVTKNDATTLLVQRLRDEWQRMGCPT